MKRIRLGARHKALVVALSLVAGAGVVYGCIPSPDTSGLPPFDAGPNPVFDANIITSFDSGDANQVGSEDSGNVDAGEDAGPGTGTIVGVVVDYEQGNGVGVVPGATVSVLNGPSTTTDAFGTFTLTNVTGGTVLLNVSNATDLTNHIAYSNTQAVVQLGKGQTVSVFPVLHEGCFEVVDMSQVEGTRIVQYSDGQIGCPYNTIPSENYFAFSFGATSFTDPAVGGGSAFTGVARIEAIPIAFPALTSSTDYSWALGLPGQSAPPGIVGAIQIRVYDTATGDALTVRSGDNVSVTMPTSQTLPGPDAGTGAQLFAYGGATATWAAVSGASTPFGGVALGTDDTNITVGTSATVPQLNGSWLAIANATQPTTCVTGTIDLPSGSPAPGVLVHGVGGSYFTAGSGVTAADGTFCLDLGAPVGDAGTQPSVEIFAGALSGGTAVGTQGVANLTTSSGSCATQSTCTTIGAPIQLSVLSGGCLSGTITAGGGCSPLPATLNVDVTSLNVSTGQRAAGVRSIAYIGSITPAGDGGAFCAPGVPGDSVVLLGPLESPTEAACQADLGITPTGGSAVSCATSSGSACQSVGATQYSAD
jgi:hypothetical protein